MKKCLIAYAAMVLVYSCAAQKNVANRSSLDNLINDTSFTTAHIGVGVFDASNNKYLVNRQADKYFVPASNTKIATCYAALKYLDSIQQKIYITDTTWKDKELGRGWSWDDYKELDNPLGIRVNIPALVWQGPVDSLLRTMMYKSDNFFLRNYYCA